MTDLFNKDRNFMLMGRVVVLTNITWAVNNIDELIAWADQAGGSMKGMIIELPNDRAVANFILKWG